MRVASDPTEAFLATLQFTNDSLTEVFRDLHAILKSRATLSYPLKDIEIIELAWADGPNREFHLHFFPNGELEVLFASNWRSESGQFRIGFLPNSVQILNILDCHQEYPLHTRHLPRNAEDVRLRTNRLFGSLDLQHLPSRLVYFDVVDNEFSGNIFFGNLPDTLKVIDLKYNIFLRRTVFYGKLPSGIKEINVSHTPIKRAKPIRQEWEVDEKLIFKF
uniref:Non-specific serine/threonine protein kinase n=1 Tax=Paramoeba aestuarina TaxID=180227 RepID=A0A7S4KIC2_9EUKA